MKHPLTRESALQFLAGDPEQLRFQAHAKRCEQCPEDEATYIIMRIVSKGSKPFCERIEKNDHQGHRRQQKTKRIDHDCRAHKKKRTHATGHDCSLLAQQDMTLRRTRIALIDFPIDDAIKGHRCRACKNHASYNQPKEQPPRPSSSCYDHGTQRKR